MSGRLVLVALTGLMWVSTAVAHRLDEYLQATTIALAPGRLTLQLRLIPGLQVAPNLLVSMDSNGDGDLSDAEKQRYIAWVRRDLSLHVNSQPVTLKLVASLVAPVSAIRQGTGGILLSFESPLPILPGAYRLTVENQHQRASSVYLINCLLPENPSIHINGQTRNVNQSVYQLRYVVERVSAPRPATAQLANPPLEQPWTERESVLKAYFVHGVKHILVGYDHLLFISALVLAAVSLWELVKIISVFTLAHSLTLLLAALHWVHLPQQIVESFIAASIVVVALQNIFQPTLAQAHSRLLIAFFFGLFHGLGFADGLLAMMQQLPKDIILKAIVGFSTGIEAGNQVVLLPIFLTLRAVRILQRDAGLTDIRFVRLQRIGSVGIMLGGLYYLWIALTNRI